MQEVSVVPIDVGWAVRSDAIDNPMLFRSGAKAEQAARRLAEALAARGDPVEIRIHLRGDGLAGRFMCRPPSETPVIAWPAGARREPRRVKAFY